MRCVFDYIDAVCPTPDEIGACYRCLYPDENCDAVPKIPVLEADIVHFMEED